MNVLLTNDDGVDADGLAALAASARRVIGDRARVTVVAPDREHSGCGHRVTVDGPLVLSERPDGPGGVKRFALDGTPADCVRIGLHHFRDLPKHATEDGGPFDWVLSGCKPRREPGGGRVPLRYRRGGPGGDAGGRAGRGG